LRSIDVSAADGFEAYLRSEAARTSRKPGKPERGARGRARKARQAAEAGKPKTLSDFTIRRRLGMAKQFFKAAVRQKLIEDNPFADKVTRVGGNEARIHFVDLDTFDKVLAALPDITWRTTAALGRHGGLRCPSEIFDLRWKDVFFDDDPRMIVRSSKTAHHEGGGIRTVPIFARLRPFLDAAYFDENAHPEFVVDPARFPSAGRNANLRTQFLRYLELAGVEPWPRLFQNLRASRVNEAVREGMTPKEIESYFGHTWAVSMESYQKVDDRDRKRWSTPAGGDTTGAQSSAQRKAQHAGASPSVVERQPILPNSGFSHSTALHDTPRYSALKGKVGPEGFEPTTKGL
jgi:integrase